MNPLNYATLEASKRLIDAGIVLETDIIWHLNGDKETYSLQTRGSSPSLLIRWGDFPAPSMAEVWRELPNWYTNKEGYKWCKSIEYENREGNIASYIDPWKYRGCKGFQRNSNPTDALIDLLIWTRKEKP